MQDSENQHPAAVQNLADVRQRTMELIAQSVVHDLNNLLGVALGHAELLRLNPQDPVKVLEKSTTIINAIKSASGIVTRMTFFDQSKAGSKSLIDASAAVVAIKSIANVLMTPGINSEFSSRARGSICVDAAAFQDAVIDILRLANDALSLRDGGRITVSVRDVLDEGVSYILFEFRDNGGQTTKDYAQGAAEKIAKDFNKKRPSSYIAAEFATRMGGRLDVEAYDGRSHTTNLLLPTSDGLSV